MGKRYYFLAVLLLLSMFSYSQDNQTRYLAAKNFYKMEKYQAALEAFKPLLSESEDNPFVIYSHYFYALSALKAGKTEDARLMAKQLILKYPSWKQIDEAHFLLGAILFEQGKFKDALEEMDDLGKGFAKDAEPLKAYYLDKMSSVESLKWLYQNFPTDKAVGTALAMKLVNNPCNEMDMMLLNYLVDEFKIDQNKLAGPPVKSIRKKEYNVAVLFPFMTSRLPVGNVNRPNQFLLDMYQGINIAADSLSKAGYKINVYAFDTEKDVNKFTSLLNDSEIKKMDLIIGPVYPAHLPVVADFAKKYNIHVVSPFSTDTSITVNNPFPFLYKPSSEHQAEELASYNLRHNKPIEKELEVIKGRGKTKEEKVFENRVIILYGTSEKDSSLAYSYSNRLKDSTLYGPKDSVFQVQTVQQVDRDNIKKIKEILTDSTLMVKVNHIAVFSDDQVIAANVISSVEIRGFSIPVFTTSDWLDFNLITIEQFERRDVHFLYPDYLDFDKIGAQYFKYRYLNNTQLYPTTFAYQGHDIMYFFGKLLHNYGTYFGKDLMKSGFFSAATLSGFNYHETQSNSYVPIVKFENGNLKAVNSSSSPKR